MNSNKNKVLISIIVILLIVIVFQYFDYSGRNENGQFVEYRFLNLLVEEKRGEFEKNGSKEPEFTANLSKVLEADTCKDLIEYLRYNTGFDFSYLVKKLNTKNIEQKKYVMKFIEYMILEEEFLNNESPNISSVVMIRPPMTSDTLNYGDELSRQFCVIMKNTNKSFRVSFLGKRDTLIEGNDILYKYKTKCTKRGENILEGTIYYYMYGQEIPNSFKYKYYVR